MARFDEEAKIIPSSRRIVLRAEISSHLLELLPTDATAEDISAALDELGSPVEIVSQELESNPPPAATRTSRASRVALIVIATLAVIWFGFAATPLVLALIAPVPGWILIVSGVVMVISVFAFIIPIRRLLR